MSRLLALSASYELRKWCVYALVLLAPGSLVILPVVWCVRRLLYADHAIRGGSGLPNAKRLRASPPSRARVSS